VLLAATGATVAAAYLSPVWFRVLFALLVVAAVAVLTGSAFRLHGRWSRAVEAARWVEARVGLEDRLLTLVTASPAARGSRLWPELVQDNESYLPRWKDARLDIPAVPRSVWLLAVAVVLAAIFLVPWRSEEMQTPLAMPRPVTLAPGAPQAEVAARRPPEPGAAVVRGADGGGADAVERESAPLGMAAIDRIQGQLDEAFRRSFGGQVMMAEREEAQDREEATAFRGDSPEAGIGETESQPGGAVPAEGLARREDGTASGPSVKSLEPSGDGRAQGGGQNARKARPAAGGGQSGEGKAGAARRKKGEGDGPTAVADGRGEGAGGAGGAGAGSGKATGPLLADQPLTLTGGRQSAQFTLTLGAAPGKGGDDGEADMVSAPTGRIATGERGAQAADRNVRREEIPPEYEGIVKRVFERNR
jgi:hypothetical protein